MNLRTTFYHLHTETKDHTAIVKFSYEEDLEGEPEKYPVSFAVEWRHRNECGTYDETEDDKNGRCIDFTVEEARDLLRFLQFVLGDNPK